MRFEHLKKEVKEPSPGARRKRVALDVKLSVFGTTIPEEKLAFSGDGESGVEAEVSDKGMEAETQELAKDAIKDAVKQAVDQAVMKLSVGKSAPMNEGKHGRRRSDMLERPSPPVRFCPSLVPHVVVAVALAAVVGGSACRRSAPEAPPQPRAQPGVVEILKGGRWLFTYVEPAGHLRDDRQARERARGRARDRARLRSGRRWPRPTRRGRSTSRTSTNC